MMPAGDKNRASNGPRQLVKPFGVSIGATEVSHERAGPRGNAERIAHSMAYVIFAGCSLTLDHMERPTSALQGAGYAVRAPLNAEPHTKEVGRDAVYNHHCLRSPRRDDGRCRVVAGPAHAGAPLADLG